MRVLYKILAGTIDLAQFGDDRVVALPLADNSWQPAVTLVDGALQKADLERQVRRTGNRAESAVYAATQFTAPKDGSVHLKIEGANPMAVYIDAKPVKGGPNRSPTSKPARIPSSSNSAPTTFRKRSAPGPAKSLLLPNKQGCAASKLSDIPRQNLPIHRSRERRVATKNRLRHVG